MGNVEPCLNLGAWQTRSRVNGPGQRFVLWMQGCLLRCAGCVNQEFLPFVDRHRIPVEGMAGRVLAVEGIEGVTYTGGEPVAQAPALALLSARLRAAGLTIVCYTGYELEELTALDNPSVARLLSSVDVLIDGPYVRHEAANLLWRGSTNQRVHFLTDAYKHLAEEMESRGGGVEFTVRCDQFTVTGNWPKGFLQRLEKVLRS
ncbi:4Fe-4S single cluster domain-containing protein [Planctomycetota bacterium]